MGKTIDLSDLVICCLCSQLGGGRAGSVSQVIISVMAPYNVLFITSALAHSLSPPESAPPPPRLRGPGSGSGCVWVCLSLSPSPELCQLVPGTPRVRTPAPAPASCTCSLSSVSPGDNCLHLLQVFRWQQVPFTFHSDNIQWQQPYVIV